MTAGDDDSGGAEEDPGMLLFVPRACRRFTFEVTREQRTQSLYSLLNLLKFRVSNFIYRGWVKHSTPSSQKSSLDQNINKIHMQTEEPSVKTRC